MADPNIQTIDLVTKLRYSDTNPDPTCDVTFSFENQSTGQKSQLFAHKLILACGSPVFMTQFFGSIEEKDPVPIKDSSIIAFRVMLDILYNKKVPLESLDFQFLGEISYLAKKYHLDLLEDAIVQEVASRKITIEKLLEAAKVAESNTHMEKFSNSLYHICSMFVKDNPASVLEVFDQEDVGEETSYSLHRLMARANRTKSKPPPICVNCKQNPCLHGQVLSRKNFVAGALVSLADDRYDVSIRRTVGLDGSDVKYLLGNEAHSQFQRMGLLSQFNFRCK